MFASANLPVFGGGVETLMTEVLLEESEAIPGVIHLHRMHRKRIPQSVRAHVMKSARLGIDQLGKPRSLSTISYNLPRSVAIDPED